MTLLTLTDLALAKLQREGKSHFSSHRPLVPPQTQQRLNLLVRQKRLGLPIQPMLEADPLLATWIGQLETCFPALFNPKKKLHLDLPLTAELPLQSQAQYRLQVPVNLGQVQGKIRLFDWKIGFPVVTWRDRSKLWVTSHWLSSHTSDLKLILLVLHPCDPLQTLTINWTTAQQQQMAQWLKDLLSNKPPKGPTQVNHTDWKK